MTYQQWLTLIEMAFTGAALVAVTLHSINLWENVANQRAIRAMPNPLGNEVAKMMVRIEGTRLAKAALVLLVGIAALSGAHPLLWAFLLFPLIGIWASILDMRSRQRQTHMAMDILLAKQAADLEAAYATPVSTIELPVVTAPVIVEPPMAPPTGTR